MIMTSGFHLGFEVWREPLRQAPIAPGSLSPFATLIGDAWAGGREQGFYSALQNETGFVLFTS